MCIHNDSLVLQEIFLIVVYSYETAKPRNPRNLGEAQGGALPRLKREREREREGDADLREDVDRQDNHARGGEQ